MNYLWIKVFFAIMAYRGLLDITYFQIISPRYLYMGFKDCRSVELCILSYSLLLVSVPFVHFLLGKKQEQGSSLVIIYLYLLSFVPFTTCVYAGILSSACIIGNSIYWGILFIAYKLSCVNKVTKRFAFKWGNIKADDKLLLLYLLLTFCIICYISFYFTGLRMIYDLDTVYQFREEARNYNIPMVGKYWFSMSRMVLTMLLGYSLYAKKWRWASVILLLQFLSFGIDGSKSVLFNVLIACLVMGLSRNVSMRMLKFRICMLFVGLVASSILEKIFMETYSIAGRIIRRICFVPNYLNEVYYDFFSVHEIDVFRGSFLRWIEVVSPYNADGGIPHVISGILGGKGFANNGMFSDAMANLGMIGIGIMPIVAIIVLRFFDKCTMQLDRGLIAAAAFPFAISFMSSSFGTVLLSHGVLMTMLLMTFIPRKSKTQEEIEVNVNES